MTLKALYIVFCAPVILGGQYHGGPVDFETHRVERKKGSKVDSNEMHNLIIGTSLRADVLKDLGMPEAVEWLNNGAIKYDYYFSWEFNDKGFFNEKRESKHESVSLIFDANDILDNVEQSKLLP